MLQPIIPKILSKDQAQCVSNLCLECMEQDLNKEMTEGGKNSLLNFVQVPGLLQRSQNDSTFILYLDGSLCIGVLEITVEKHILLFFISPQKRKQGLGRSLFQKCLQEFPAPVTAYSTAAALPVYLILGFEMHGPAKTVDGVTGYPVVYYGPE